MPPEKGKRLGRGLDALIGGPAGSGTAAAAEGPMREIPVADIQPNPFQPRKHFDAGELKELEESLAANGLLQPVTVRKSAAGRGWELVAGERRFRAASNLAWATIPAIVRDYDDRTLLTLALVENLQRADLNPMEEAEGYHRLATEFSLTHQQIAEIVGKNRSTVANSLRLLQLPAEVRRMIDSGNLTAGHARALLAFGDPARIRSMAKEVVEAGLSVRDVERAAQNAEGSKRKPAKSGKRDAALSPEVRTVQDQIRRRLQTDVFIALDGPDRGTLSVRFYSAADLERIMELMGAVENT